MVTRTYRMDHDLGFAPNPYFGWCSLACCMPQIRKSAKLGDIIIGLAGAGKRGLRRIHPQIVYWMRVQEILSFDEYWTDPRFINKTPRINGPKIRMVGDRTYRHEPNDPDWSFERSMHYMPNAPQTNGGHVAKDTKVDRLLLSEDFTYWGGIGPTIPPHLIGLFPNPRGQKCPSEGPLLNELHDLVGVHAPKGVTGDPADWHNLKYFKG